MGKAAKISVGKATYIKVEVSVTQKMGISCGSSGKCVLSFSEENVSENIYVSRGVCFLTKKTRRIKGFERYMWVVWMGRER